MNTLGIWEPYSVKAQVYKTAIEVSESHTDVTGEFHTSPADGDAAPAH